jgi:hypothetical protein
MIVKSKRALAYNHNEPARKPFVFVMSTAQAMTYSSVYIIRKHSFYGWTSLRQQLAKITGRNH